MFEKDISNLCKPEIKGRGFIGSGNEIIETQTYFTVPETDWEFDTDQKLTYNNPVFIEQCKRRGLKFDELNKGWVPQYKLDEKDDDIEEVDDEDDELEDDEEIDEDELFVSSKKSSKPNHLERLDKSKTMKTINDDGQEITFKFGKKEESSNETKEDIKPVNLPEVTLEDLEQMFTSEKQPNESNRDKVTNALNQVDSPPSLIKLNLDKTVSSTSKPKIKLNIKQTNK